MLQRKTLLSGTLSDGTPFAFSSVDSRTATDFFATGTLTLEATALPAIGATVINIPDDPVPLGIRTGQTLNVTAGGKLGDGFNAGSGSSVVITDGVVGHFFDVVNGHVTISGGSVGSSVDAFNGSTVAISGGSVGNYLEVYDGSLVDISGGSVGTDLQAFSGSTVNVSGGSVGDYFAALGGIVNITGGTVGDHFEASSGSTVNISGGSVGQSVDAESGSTVNISGGSIDHSFRAHNGSIVNVSGGTIGNVFNAGINTMVNISGGSFGRRFDASSSILNISGGTFGDDFDVIGHSEINLYGTEFLLDGLEIAGLIHGQPFTIADRDVTISGFFADGSPFSFDMNSTIEVDEDFFSSEATLTVTLLFPGDFDGDGDIDGSDFLKWERGQQFDPLNTSDLADWENNFGTIASLANIDSTTVPEPTTGTMLVILIVTLQFRDSWCRSPYGR